LGYPKQLSIVGVMNYSPRYGLFRLLLRKIREEAGLSQMELSKKLKKPQTFVSKSEIGERRIDFIETLDFCRACGMSMPSFVKRLEEKQNEKAKPRNKRKSPRTMDAEGRMIGAGEKTENAV
jgi:transcriptional regulator with XRE-family HTH domain